MSDLSPDSDLVILERLDSSGSHSLHLPPGPTVRKSTSAIIALTVLLLSGCCPETSTFPATERAAVEAEIGAARDAYFEAATTFDADAMVSMWDESFIHLSNGSIVPLTLAGLREAWGPLGHIEMDIGSDRIVALSRDAGYTIMTATYTVFDTAGVALGGSEWAATHIWVRTDGGWKVQAVHEGRPGA